MDPYIDRYAACAACDLVARLRQDLRVARSGMRRCEADVARAVGRLLAADAELPRELIARLRHERTRVDALEQMLGDLLTGHGDCQHAA